MNDASVERPRLLVVDDERVQRTLVARTVAPMGYIVDEAANLEEASSYLLEHSYDAVVLDLLLGETEGISLLRALREGSGERVLIFLSRLDERVLTASLRLASGMGLRVAGTLRKPASPTALRALLRADSTHAPPFAESHQHPPDPATIEHAIRTGLIVPYYQPQVSLRDGRPVGVEALARWPRQGADGFVDDGHSPEVFVAVAEQHDLIIPLTFEIMRASLQAYSRWRVWHPNCRVSVNLSPLVLADPALPDQIERLLLETGVGPGALIAEITESTVIANPLLAAEVLTRLRIKGIDLSIDDFGTGHSSLLTLLRLPFTELKIDRSFISACETDCEAWKIVRATTSMARELGLRVVAEGIETEAVAGLLRQIDCEVGQGWYFGRAMPEAELLRWLSRPSLTTHPALPRYEFPAVNA